MEQWIARSIAYGVADSRVAAKHVGVSAANPWRFVFLVHPVSRVLMALTCLWPSLGVWLARVVLRVAHVGAGVGVVAADGAALAAGTALAGGVGRYSGPGWPQADSRGKSMTAAAVVNFCESFTIRIMVR